jgi:hypothetical protein
MEIVAVPLCPAEMVREDGETVTEKLAVARLMV